ncbi:MAG TPA: energy-coupling factor transporter transmembrane protein EcfT, partial [Actinomycetes bacterium]|nr:energy-coupling factor transporter transmembrane protein EcfT [Actinomycetes bacterium]
LPLLLVGVVASAAALWTGAKRDPRSRYRPDPWAFPEWAVVGTGLVTVTVVVACAQARLPGIVPPTSPAAFPELPWQAVAGVLFALLAAVVSPEPPLRAALRTTPQAPTPTGAPA